ncbi:MAG: hypothetical protein H6Q00_272 [Holophagaceae bacterium]|nr:hypothetical protein [Holophagaceae bacterium]
MFRLIRYLLSLACAMSLFAAGPSPDRIALVIGNDSYQHVGPLKNAKGDAKAIAQTFERMGFRVILRLDLNEKGMKDAIRTFKGMVKGGDAAVFFFSGHGVQIGGSNYLLPTDIRGDSEDQVRDEALPLQRVLDDLQDQKARFSLAIIDACRNNPFKGAGRSIGGRGLTVTTAATGQMVLYSAGAGQQALDSLGPSDRNPNGLFTRVLLKEIAKPGVPADRVLRNVRDEVVRLAQGVGQEQVPALYDQALGEFYFKPGAPLREAAPAPEPAPLPSPLGAPPVAAALLGGLQVSVNVAAKIYLDGSPVGEASPAQALNLRDLPVGRVSLRAEASGYGVETQVFDIREGQWTQARLVLSRESEATPAEPRKGFWSKLNPTKLMPSKLVGGAKPTAVAPDSTALSQAAMRGDTDKLNELIKAGGNLNAYDKWGWTPLLWAIYYGKIPAVVLLLEHQADPNLKSSKAYGPFQPGISPLIVAAYYGHEEAVEALLKRHADRKVTDNNGKTALDWALQFRFDSCAERLKRR